MNVPQGIAVAVVAQRDILLALTHTRREGHAPFLVLHGARQRDRRQGIALRQDQHRLRQRHCAERAEQPERVGARQRYPGEPQDAATQRRDLDLHFHLLAGRDWRHCGILHRRQLERITGPAAR